MSRITYVQPTDVVGDPQPALIVNCSKVSSLAAMWLATSFIAATMSTQSVPTRSAPIPARK